VGFRFRGLQGNRLGSQDERTLVLVRKSSLIGPYLKPDPFRVGHTSVPTSARPRSSLLQCHHNGRIYRFALAPNDPEALRPVAQSPGPSKPSAAPAQQGLDSKRVSLRGLGSAHLRDRCKSSWSRCVGPQGYLTI